MWRSYFCQAMCICFVRPNFKLFCSRQHRLSFAKSLPDKVHCCSQHYVSKVSLKVILSVSLLIIDLSYVQITLCIIIYYCFNSTSIWQLNDYEVIMTIGYYGINSPSSSTNGIAMSGQAWARTGCVSYTSCIDMNRHINGVVSWSVLVKRVLEKFEGVLIFEKPLERLCMDGF